MSERNVEIVRAAIEAFNRGDLETLVGALDADAEVIEDPRFPDATNDRGPDGFRRAVGRWRDAWAAMPARIEELLDGGDRVLAVMGVEFEGRESELPFEMRMFAVFSFAGDRVTRVVFAPDREAALGAAGLA